MTDYRDFLIAFNPIPRLFYPPGQAVRDSRQTGTMRWIGERLAANATAPFEHLLVQCGGERIPTRIAYRIQYERITGQRPPRRGPYCETPCDVCESAKNSRRRD